MLPERQMSNVKSRPARFVPMMAASLHTLKLSIPDQCSPSSRKRTLKYLHYPENDSENCKVSKFGLVAANRP
jgi:hypothetical protein